MVAFLLKVCIFDKNYSKKNSQVRIPWLCNLTVSDPYDLQPHKKKKPLKNKKKEPTEKKKEKNQVIWFISTNEEDTHNNGSVLNIPKDKQNSTSNKVTNMKISMVEDLMG